MASKRRNMFYKNEKQETTEIALLWHDEVGARVECGMSRLESLLQYDEGGGESLDSLQYDAGSSVAAEDEAGLEFDMWEGQFEFIGQQYPDNNNTIEVSLNKKAALTNGHHEQVEDLQLGSPLKNGKVAATPRHHTQAWCRHLNHHVSTVGSFTNLRCLSPLAGR
ncbi:hypothetical protein AAG570_013769 [Ranatra chinensis]|uniref:Uncharacterized protein n=1 Tax=Ranatra chinensis TaxID=642074 RepID=A0ABD0YD48_9HEMI